MALRSEDRYADGQEMFIALRDWLEGATRRSEALAVVQRADALRPRIEALRAQATMLRLRAEARLVKVPSYAPEEQKAPGWKLQDEAADLEQEAALVELEYTETLQSALKKEPALREAHQRLADHYRRRHAASEAAQDRQSAALEEALLRTHDHGRHQAYLQGEGTLRLATDPPDAMVTLFSYVRHHRRLVPRFLRHLGPAPLRDIPLPMGSYLLVLRAPGRATVRYPVWLGRQDQWRARPPGASSERPVHLPALGDLRPDEVYIPAGWFVSGGDPHAYQSLPHRRLWAEAFIIQRFPVTNQRFLDFLNVLVAAGEEGLALRCAPRQSGGQNHRYGPLIYGRDAEGRFVLRPDAEGDLWLPNWPVVMIDRPAATLYAAWLSKQTGVRWRLPTNLEREKASRGVDGRGYPWGDFADPSWSCTQTSQPNGSMMATVDRFPIDVSPYGVRHTAGLVRDWCSTPFSTEGEPIPNQRVPRPRPLDDSRLAEVRGGSWNNRESWARCALRFGYPTSSRFSDLGFRLVRDP